MAGVNVWWRYLKFDYSILLLVFLGRLGGGDRNVGDHGQISSLYDYFFCNWQGGVDCRNQSGRAERDWLA